MGGIPKEISPHCGEAFCSGLLVHPSWDESFFEKVENRTAAFCRGLSLPPESPVPPIDHLGRQLLEWLSLHDLAACASLFLSQPGP